MILEKTLLVFTLVFALMVLALPAYAQKLEDYFYGELDQWPSVEADTVVVRSGKVLSLKATQTREALYLNLKMPKPEMAGTFYLETENDELFGYYGDGLWRDNPSIHYKIEGEKLYSYQGTGFGEDWLEIGPVKAILLPEDLIVRIDFALLGFDAPQPLKVAYYLDSLDYLPADGNPMLRVSRRIFGDEATVLQQEFWDSRTTAAHNAERELILKTVRDHEKLFVLVEGWDFNTRNTYFLKVGGAEGFSHQAWPGSNFTHKVDGGILYKYAETSPEGWEQIGPVYTYITGAAVVMAVDLNLLGADSDSVLKIGYENAKGTVLPRDGELVNASAQIKQPLRENAFYPVEYHGTLNNPFKGWVAWADSGANPQPHRLVYAGISWRELEPERGVFDWEGIEEKYLFDYWESKGVKFVLRMVLDLPRKGPAHMDIPDWLYEMTDGRGTWYNTSEIGNGFSPDYNNPTFIAEHRRMVAALAERYNDDPRVGLIQLGSLGHWGEWHTWPEGSGVFPKSSVSDQYVMHYVENFTNKMIGIRRPFAIVKEHNLGLFNDSFGDVRATEEWIGWFKQGRLSEPPMPDFWKHAYSGGEFRSGNALLHLNDERIAEVLQLARDSHTSWMGPCSPANVPIDAPAQVHLDAFLKTIGYRFVIRSVEHAGTVVKGETLAIDMVWQNSGVAPFYLPWPLSLALVDQAGQIVNVYQTDVDIRQLLPGRTALQVGLPIEPQLEEGTYSLAVAILDPDTNEPGIDLAITGRRADGWYILNEINLENN